MTRSHGSPGAPPTTGDGQSHDKTSSRVAAGATAPGGISPAVRERIAQSFTRVEDVVYVGLGFLLAGGALVCLSTGG
jgi:hypothetical protein